MLPEARIEHAIAGRVRLKVPEMRGDTGYFDQLSQAMAALEGIGSVTVRPATGSILLEDMRWNLSTLAQLAYERGWFLLDSLPLQRMARTADGPADWLPNDRSLAALRPSLVIVLLALAAVQAARGQVMVPAIGLLWFAFALARREDAPAAAATAWHPAEHQLH